MIVVVYGGNASGKSQLAERIAVELYKEQSGSRLIYLATMKNDGTPEARSRIAAHRSRRAGAGFQTIEWAGDDNTVASPEKQQDASASASRGILWDGSTTVERREDGSISASPENLRIPAECTGATVLLEDLGNLLANIMFADPKAPQSAAETQDAAEGLLDALIQSTANLIVVANNIFDGGYEIDPVMRAYSDALGRCSTTLATRCDVFVESVCGLPRFLKGSLTL